MRNKKIIDLTKWFSWLSKRGEISSSELEHLRSSLIDIESDLLNSSNNFKDEFDKDKNINILSRNKLFILFFFVFVSLFISLLLFIFLFFFNTDISKSIFRSSGRVIPFKGSISSTDGKSIDSKKDVVFRLYADSEQGKPLYEGFCKGENAILPEISGKFTVSVGEDCGMTPIPDLLFEKYDVFFLGITVGGGAELLPRYQIFTTSYTQNAESLSSRKTGTKESSIPYIDEKGTINLSAKNPIIRSTNSMLAIEGPSLSFTTRDDVNGDIIFKPAPLASVVIENGNLGIGNPKPNALLDVEGNFPFGTATSIKNLSLQDDEKTASLTLGLGAAPDSSGGAFINFYAGATRDNDGSLVGGVRLNNDSVVYETNGADFAEYFNTKYENTQNYGAGTIMGVTEKGVVSVVEGERPFGVISKTAGFIGNSKPKKGDYSLIALIGQVPVLVSNLNGELKTGDSVVLSKIPGFGIKGENNINRVGYVLSDISKDEYKNELCPKNYRKLQDLLGKKVKCTVVPIILLVD